MTTASSPTPSSTILARLPFLTTLLAGRPDVAKDQELLPILARQDPEVFREARAELPALRTLPEKIDTYAKLQKGYEDKRREKPVTTGIFGAETVQEIKSNLKDVAWQAPITATVWGGLGFVGGWGLGAFLGGALGTILDLPLAATFGDVLSCAFITGSVYLATRCGMMWGDFWGETNPKYPRHMAAFKAVAPFTTLAAGGTFLATRLSAGSEFYHEFAQHGPGTPLFWSAVALSIAAAVGASFVGSVVAPMVNRTADNVKTRYRHWSETRSLKKALRAFEKIGLSTDRLTGKLSTDTKRLAAFADGPLKAYLTQERDKLRQERDVLRAELARVTAGKQRAVLFKEGTPTAQRERILAKLTRTEDRLNQAIAQLERDGIAVFESILAKIPKLLGDIKEWDGDQNDVIELAALETLAEDGEDKANDAEIMLRLSRERLGALAERFQAMIADIRASRQATIEVERLSSSIRERPQITEQMGLPSDVSARQREVAGQLRTHG